MKKEKKKVEKKKRMKEICPGCGEERFLNYFIRQHTPHAHLKLRIKVCKDCYEKTL